VPIGERESDALLPRSLGRRRIRSREASMASNSGCSLSGKSKVMILAGWPLDSRTSEGWLRGIVGGVLTPKTVSVQPR